MTKKAVLLLSGGLDSATVLVMASAEGYEMYALSFSYGQKHSHELTRAKQIAEGAGVAQHRVAQIDLGAFAPSALTDSAIAVPKDRLDSSTDIPATYVPARNTIFLSYALAWAEVLEARDIFIGVNALDYSGYPDCRPEFIAAFETVANLATACGVSGNKTTIHAPLIAMTKAEIIAKGLGLGLDYSATSSCYDPAPNGDACGHCDACRLRLKGFAENGIKDPASYTT